MMTFRGNRPATLLGALALTLSFACGTDKAATGDETQDGSDSDKSTSASDGTTQGPGETSETNGQSTTAPGGTDSDSQSTTNDSNVTTDPTSEETTGCGFICPEETDGESAQCDPGIQDCPDGEKCTPYVMEPGYCCVDSTHCVQVMGESQFGDPCTREDDTDDCAMGLFCMTETSGSSGSGVCLNLCDVSNPNSCADAGQSGAECVSFNGGVLPLCEDPCDPLLQDCGGGMGCYAGGDAFVCAVTVDNPPGDGGECYTIQSCQPGLVCVGSGSLGDCASERCCTPWCDLTEPDPDAQCIGPMESCTAWFEDPPPGHEDVGVCAVPA
jgi:hypothetical protein